ncbi:MAG: Gfo/Idh/MocA family oxidoreductase [Gemmatimonadota bacterium]|nr:Gfo/Idh/MocA family oxidoreductase [Gemmatimonadota bacterium]
MSESIGVGVIGLGMGQDMYLLHQDPGSRFEVRGICASTEEKTRTVAEQHGTPFRTTEYRELVERPEIDVVAVYSPDHLHGDHCIAALEAGNHVVCTKPLVGRSHGEGVLEECDRIVRLAQSKGLKFLVGQTMRFDPEFHAAKQFFDDGDLGDILMAESHYVHDIRGVAEYTPWRVDAPQDFLFGGACHPIDTLRWFFGDVEEVFVYANRSGLTPEYPIEDNFIINLKFTRGTIARILAAYGIIHPPMPMMGLSLYGTKGSIRCDYTDFKGGHVHVIFDKMNGLPEFETSFDPIMEGSYGHGHAVRQYMAHLEDCIVNDGHPSPDAAEGAKTIAVGAACWESVLTGQPVKVRNTFG